MGDFTPEQKAAWREEQKRKPQWKVHSQAAPGALVAFHSKRTGDGRVGYVVGPDGNYQRIDRLMAKKWASMTPEQRQEVIAEAQARAAQQKEQAAA